MKLKRIEIRNILEAIVNLKNNVEKGINKFSFATDYALSRNIRLLQPTYIDIMDGQKTLLAEIPAEFILDKSDEKYIFNMTKINESKSDPLQPLNDFMDGEEEVEVFLIDGNGLFPEKNDIGNAVEILYPLFKE